MPSLDRLHNAPKFTFVPNRLHTFYSTRDAVLGCQREKREAGEGYQFNPNGTVYSDKDLYTSSAYTCAVCILGQRRGPSTMLHFWPDTSADPLELKNVDFLIQRFPKTVAEFITGRRKGQRQDIMLIGGIHPNAPGLTPERAKETKELFEHFKRGIHQGMEIAGQRVPVSILWGQTNKDWGTEILYRPSQNRVYLSCLPYYGPPYGSPKNPFLSLPPITLEGTLDALKKTYSVISLPNGSGVQTIPVKHAQKSHSIKRPSRNRFRVRPRRNTSASPVTTASR